MAASDTSDGFSHIYRYARARVTPITGTSVTSVTGRVGRRNVHGEIAALGAAATGLLFT